MKISEIVSNFPEYAKDIKLNYTKILNEQVLNQNQLYGIILISSFSSQLSALKDARLKEIDGKLDESFKEAVFGAYSIMSMNAIYYRFTHLITDISII